MATNQAIRPIPFETALALANCQSSEVITNSLAMRLVALPTFQQFIRCSFLDESWTGECQSRHELETVQATGKLFAAGIIYGQLFGGMASPLMIALVSSPTEVVQ